MGVPRHSRLSHALDERFLRRSRGAVTAHHRPLGRVPAVGRFSHPTGRRRAGAGGPDTTHGLVRRRAGGLGRPPEAADDGPGGADRARAPDRRLSDCGGPTGVARLRHHLRHGPCAEPRTAGACIAHPGHRAAVAPAQRDDPAAGDAPGVDAHGPTGGGHHHWHRRRGRRLPGTRRTLRPGVHLAAVHQGAVRERTWADCGRSGWGRPSTASDSS